MRMAVRPFDEVERLHARYGEVVGFGFGPVRFVVLRGPRANEWLLNQDAAAFTWVEAMSTFAVGAMHPSPGVRVRLGG